MAVTRINMLLERTDLTIEDIRFGLGFNSNNKMIEAFFTSEEQLMEITFESKLTNRELANKKASLKTSIKALGVPVELMQMQDRLFLVRVES